jgi:hypothetical protein
MIRIFEFKMAEERRWEVEGDDGLKRSEDRAKSRSKGCEVKMLGSYWTCEKKVTVCFTFFCIELNRSSLMDEVISAERKNEFFFDSEPSA